MICIFFISGSNFKKKIPYNLNWNQYLQNNYIVKNCKVADINILEKECYKFIENCKKCYHKPIIGVLGLSSGGYYALRLKKIITTLMFCITIAPVINPQFRKKYLEQLPYSTKNIRQLIKMTPNVRKIYNKIDKDTLIIIGKKDIQVPIEMFNHYNIPNLIILQNESHSITHTINTRIVNIINRFITF